VARDYRSAEVFSPGTRPLPLWLWLFAVVAVGGFAGLIYHLDKYEKSRSGAGSVAGNTEATAPAVVDSKAPDKSKDSETHFDFYKLLPNISVDVPKVGGEQQRQPAASTEKPATVTPGFSYILQVGSFRDYHEADRLKARLAFLGIEVKIEKVTLHDSETWHRVRIGPLQSEREMNKIRGQLREQNIDPILLKVKA